MSHLKIPALLLLATPIVAFSADKWIPISDKSPGMFILNMGHIQTNGYGNQVATIRHKMHNGIQTDIVTEFDCRLRKVRALSSATVDKDGRLLTAAGPQDRWFPEEQSLGLDHICRK